MPASTALLDRFVSPLLRRWVAAAFPRTQSLDYDQPSGDLGLFGPDSVAWKIHADFPGMLAGGLCALMLQTLHPRALAAIYDHSRFREDLLGRLRRTTSFVGATTYAPRATAEAQIARVRAIHARVRGHTADGQAYAADEPALLTWVHATESYGFLQGYRTYCHSDLPPDAANRYLNETRRIAEALGAREVPRSEAEITDYFHQIQVELRYDERSREVLDTLCGLRLPVPLPSVSRELFLGAGAALLPGWARSRLPHPAARPLKARVSRQSLRAMAPAFRFALNDGVASRSCRRVGVSPAILRHWDHN